MTFAYCSSLIDFYGTHHITPQTKAAKLLKMTVASCSSVLYFYGVHNITPQTQAAE
jgi:hypothetical protein